MEGSKEFITSFDFEASKSATVVKSSAQNPAKRTFSQANSQDNSSFVGPDARKKPKQELDEILLENLPKAELYERSLMHRDIVNHGKLLRK